MLQVEAFDKADALPELHGMAVDGAFCDPTRFRFTGAPKLNPPRNATVSLHDVGSVFFHQFCPASHPRTAETKFALDQEGIATSQPTPRFISLPSNPRQII
jgi:hypothetical protein